MKKINWQYTFAEILIVIVGITIAFSLNKCSDNSKNKALKLQYLTSLKNDIEADKKQLQNNVLAITEKIKLCGEVIDLLNKDMPQKMGAINKLFKIAVLSNFDAKDITYKTLINSGDFKLIDDFELKTAIEEHYSDYEIMLKAYQRQENIHKEHLGNYLIHNADYDAFAIGKFGFENEKLLKNIIQSIRGSLLIKLKATKKGIGSCDNLLFALQ
ncbi:hypothetical protein JYT76_01630 [Olleya sp. AH-315-F22]|nr:hypothetical protein [Olleya sp. AH-315-F22]